MLKVKYKLGTGTIEQYFALPLEKIKETLGASIISIADYPSEEVIHP